ncbi:Amidase [Penicillium soppii]|uniref:Amidase n=1 Tax=Penicillium soppii TaxID=69789 RepID=UPI0025471B36|nr:Amidase [Penicillium soppii]KAJ5872983.1 Amidase [Penicillium soppii]
MTISQFHQSLRKDPSLGPVLLNKYIEAITHHDQTLKSIITLNPHAQTEATQKQSDSKSHITSNSAFPPLHSIPIILKDNYTTNNLPTTAGVKALSTLQAPDNKVVTRLKKAGAIILAKANLHEFALQGITLSSRRGQTINPYDPTRTPGGSSGGTAAAIAAGFGLLGCGTDTVNSVRSPASACGIVGFRPSTGRVPCDGIVPVSKTQDVAGPMGTCVADVRVLYRVMAGLEPASVSAAARKSKVRIGVLDAYFLPDEGADEEVMAENGIVQGIVRSALGDIGEDEDIVLVPVSASCHPDWSFGTLLEKGDTQAFEFRDCLDEFLQMEHVESPHRSLESVVRSGEFSREAVTEVFTAGLEDPDTYSMTSKAYLARLAFIESLKSSVQECFEAYELDALSYPHQRQLPVKLGARKQCGRNGLLAALTGRPAICIPAGRSPKTASAVLGVPVGLEFMGRHWGEDELLDLAERAERILQIQQAPDLGFVSQT